MTRNKIAGVLSILGGIGLFIMFAGWPFFFAVCKFSIYSIIIFIVLFLIIFGIAILSGKSKR